MAVNSYNHGVHKRDNNEESNEDYSQSFDEEW